MKNHGKAKQREFRISIVALIRIFKSKLKVMPWHNELNLVKLDP